MSQLEHGGPERGCEVSIIVPVYNEVGSLVTLHEEITSSCAGKQRKYEVLFIDDGSTDGSGVQLDQLAARDPRIKVIHLRKNFGKSAALAAGFSHVRGQIILTMDADLQDDPAMIPQFIERIAAGADMVSGWKQRRHDPLRKTLTSRFFNTTVKLLSGIPLRDFNCGFKAYRIECVRELNVYGSLHRFLPVFAEQQGFKIEQLVVNHRPRLHGESKFGTKRFIEGFLDLFTVLLLTRFRTRPLHFFVIPGFGLGVVGLAILSYLTVIWFMGHSIGTRPLLNLGMLCTIAATQFLAIGLMAELVVRTTIRPREVFSIREVVQQEAPVAAEVLPADARAPAE